MSESIPTCADLASDPLVHRYDDLFNPPGLTNFLGCAQVDHDVLALRSVNFPPYSQSDTVTGQLYVDGRLARSFGAPVTVTWQVPVHGGWATPSRVTATGVVGGAEMVTVVGSG